MRLTLRTLLAYLDNTLDPQDAESLRTKIDQSGYATQLVSRIRGTLADRTLPAPSPEAVGPVEDANVISEYLDSTLPAEQVAEIERACLESAPHLAEAAACHQILTMILGQPAEVSPELRKRIYELPDRELEDIAKAGSFSSVVIPDDALATNPLTTPLPSRPVQPVGVTDSGVSDAPTRLREAEEATAAGEGSGATAGSSPRGVRSRSDIYGGSIRPSRIAPWLVSLALAAVLLFALARIFQPLLTPKTARVDPAPPAAAEIEVPSDQSPPLVEVETPVIEDVSGDELLPPPEPAAPEPEPPATEQPSQPAQSEVEPVRDATDATIDRPAEVPMEGEAADDTSATPPVDAGATAADRPAPPDDPETPATPVPAPSPPESDSPVPPAATEVIDRAAKELAKILSKDTLLAGLVGDQWVRLSGDMMVGDGLEIACAPTFRGEMATEAVRLTVVGPAQVQWLMGDSDEVILHVDYGGVLVSARKSAVPFWLQLGEERIQLKLGDDDTVAAASVVHFRAPGFDPLKPEHRVARARIIALQGNLEVEHAGDTQPLATGQQWVKRGRSDAEVSPLDERPKWIDEPDPSTTTLEQTARQGLLQFLEGDQPLELALREATLFRRAEVGALAAQTLAHLGLGDVYFGGDGILNEVKQRAYWYDHFRTLLVDVDRSAQSAQRLRDSIDRMDSANAQPLFRLLTGYSQKQLEEGGDEELVELLDSPSMAVRVLALENLHRITGTTLYFRPEQENAVRRAPGIKKWVVRLRKGDIRWQE